MVACLTVPSLVSCIEEARPMNGSATNEQVEESPAAAATMVNGLPAYAKLLWRGGDFHWAFGYPAIMHIRDIMTGDMAIVESGYNQFSPWCDTEIMGPQWVTTQFVWQYYYGYVLACNLLIGGINETTANDAQKGYLGVGLAYRAMSYLEMAQMYEFLPNDQFKDGKNEQGVVVTGLTCPIVTDTLSVEQSRNNPRATHEEMATFIENDLNKAEKYIVYSADNKANTLPNLAVVYGLKARFYLWNAQYDKAKEYARKAINEYGGQPMTEEEATNVVTGFNDLSKWMWGQQCTAEDDVVKTGILNWTSWMSNETTFGYASAGPQVMISKAVYDSIPNTDWRKGMYKAPAGDPMEAKNKYLKSSYKESIPEYGSLKFRPNKGNDVESTVGVASAFPMMRVEEMYFIEAEAAERLAAGEGIKLLTTFMKQYRDPDFTYTGKDGVAEILFNKRVELFGEGISFFDYKRTNMSVTRGYTGTNFYEKCRFNTVGRPAWMNFCIVRSEGMNNPAVEGKNNPDPTKKYPIWR